MYIYIYIFIYIHTYVYVYDTLAPLRRRLAALFGLLFRDLLAKRLVVPILHRYICHTYVCIRHNIYIYVHKHIHKHTHTQTSSVSPSSTYDFFVSLLRLPPFSLLASLFGLFLRAPVLATHRGLVYSVLCHA